MISSDEHICSNTGKRRLLFFSLLLVLWTQQTDPTITATHSQEGCTIGVACAHATADGRPLLWKIRDNSAMPNTSLSYDTSFSIRFIAVTNSGEGEVWMGVNEKGFAILNSNSVDLPGGSSGLSNGLLMRYALGTCGSVDDFERLLDSTDVAGRMTQGNFGTIDSTGAAEMFEVGGYAHWRFGASESPGGYVLRTNFSMNGGGSLGMDRFRRAVAQIREFQYGDSLNHRSIMRYHARDFSDANSIPIPIPYPHAWNSDSPLGYIYAHSSISRYRSVSAATIEGVRQGEPPTMTTMWTILGQPASGIVVPYWPIGTPPGPALGNTSSPLYEVGGRIRSLLFDCPLSVEYIDSYKLRDQCGNGLWSWTFPAEDSISNAADRLLTVWRRSLPTANQILEAESGFASYALSQLTDAYTRLAGSIAFPIANSVPYRDENGKTLENGDVIQLIWAGEDGVTDPPNMQPGNQEWGQPTGDDRLVGVPHNIGENVSVAGTVSFRTIGWRDRSIGCPAAGDLVYLRAFNSSDLGKATRYGDAQLHLLSVNDDNLYDPLLEGGRTTRWLKGALAAKAVQVHLNLSPNFPNPFNSSTVMEVDVPATQNPNRYIELKVFNILGEMVRDLSFGYSEGNRRLEWDGQDDRGQVQPSGVYFIRLKDGRTVTLRKMVLLK